MQLLKPQFDSFKNLLPEIFKEVALNKSEDKTYINYFCGDRTVHEMKGVRSDFIKTFKAKLNDENSYSIGFSFKYYDVKENEQTIQVSLKVGDREPLYYKGKHLTIMDFRIQFNEVIEKIKLLETKDYKEIAQIITEHFNLLPSHHPKIQRKSVRKIK